MTARICSKGAGQVFLQPVAAAIDFIGHLRPDHIVVLAQNARRHVGRARADRRELEAPAGIFPESDSAWRSCLDGARYLVDRGGIVPVVHADDRFTGLLDPVQDLLVFDFEFCVALSFFADFLPEGVVFAGVRGYVCQNGQLVDVGVVFRVDVLEIRLEAS
jgi:hypothetical protein